MCQKEVAKNTSTSVAAAQTAFTSVAPEKAIPSQSDRTKDSVGDIARSDGDALTSQVKVVFEPSVTAKRAKKKVKKSSPPDAFVSVPIQPSTSEPARMPQNYPLPSPFNMDATPASVPLNLTNPGATNVPLNLRNPGLAYNYQNMTPPLVHSVSGAPHTHAAPGNSGAYTHYTFGNREFVNRPGEFVNFPLPSGGTGDNWATEGSDATSFTNL